MAYESELEALPEFEDEFEAELESELESESVDEMEDEAGLEGEGWLGALGNIASSLLGEQEMEGEDEFESEDEAEISPIRKIYPDAMMEHLGELAAESASEDEAVEHFLPLIGMAASKLLPVVAKAVAPMAKRALPKIAKALTKSTPHLTKGVGRVAKVLHRNPQTRHLLRAVPSIARRTVGNIARQAARGRQITPRSAVRTLAKQTRYVLGNPRQRQHALRRHKHLERRFHGRLGRGIARPHYSGRAPQVAAPRYGTAAHAVPGASAGTPAHGGTSAGTPAPVGRTGVRTGTTVAGQCTCAPCPACGGTTATGQATPTSAPAPAYCRCCGQVIR
ncbi:MAG TPA: hypothetical protein VN911_06835 [Candidatus Acidoferrum sp.]|nr:hypothetical protein [Candidatus Acidoferrum sp.]